MKIFCKIKHFRNITKCNILKNKIVIRVCKTFKNTLFIFAALTVFFSLFLYLVSSIWLFLKEKTSFVLEIDASFLDIPEFQVSLEWFLPVLWFVQIYWEKKKYHMGGRYQLELDYNGLDVQANLNLPPKSFFLPSFQLDCCLL